MTNPLRFFSQRKGFKPIRKIIQKNDVDEVLRNRLWNIIYSIYWKELLNDYQTGDWIFSDFIDKMWDIHFEKSFDVRPQSYHDVYNEIRYSFFEHIWHYVYDLLEYFVNYYPVEEINKIFIEKCNIVLKEELSAYRFVDKFITEITSEEEIIEIEEALKTPLNGVITHLNTALRLLSDKKSPDYRNSIKESISSVEAICNIITKEKNDTLGQALKKIEKIIPIHGALKEAFSNLYGYTSNAEGIRHALMDEPDLYFEDAKFMLVSCSAFINYLVSKASKTGIKLKK